MSTSSASNQDKKDGSSKKKNKKNKDKRSADQDSALSPILEGKDLQLDEDGNPIVPDGEEDSEHEDDDKESDSVMVFLRQMQQSLSQEIRGLADRVTSLETRRNLNEEEGFNTPDRNHGGSDSKAKRSKSLLASVANSAVRKDWRDIMRADNQLGDNPSASSGSSSSSSDSSSDSSSEEEEKPTTTRRAKERRSRGKAAKKDKKKAGRHSKQNLGYLFKSIEASEKHASNTVVSITRTEKECKVNIDNFSLGHVCKAMKTIMEFQEREGTLVNMSKVLSRSCKNHLRIMYNIQSTDLPTIGMSTLFSVIAKETKVHSKVQFYNELKSALGNIRLMEWEKVNPNNHEEYYFQQLKLTDEFMMLLRIMLQENKVFCPSINDKENGLIRLFRTFHSYSYWKYIWAGMKQKYRNMQEFIDEYSDKAMQQYQLSLATREIPYAKGGKSSDKEKQYYDRKREISKSFNSSSYSKSYDKPKHTSFNNINSEFSGSDSDESTWRNANPVVSKEDKVTDEEQAISNSEDSLSEASNENEEVIDDEGMLDKTLAAFNNHKEVKADKKDYPCLRKIMSGKCEQPDCPYGHRREVLLKGAHDMKAKLAAFINAQGEPARDSSGPPYKVLQREKYTKN